MDERNIDTKFDWEGQGYPPDRIVELITRASRKEIDNIKLYNDTGTHKWIFLGNYHRTQHVALAIGRFSSPEYYKEEHGLLSKLHQKVPQFFPYVYDFFSINPGREEIVDYTNINGKGSILGTIRSFWKSFSAGTLDSNGSLISGWLMESLDNMNTAFDFKEKRRYGRDLQEILKHLAEREGYAAGFTLSKTELVATNPHPLNTLVHRNRKGIITVKFVDAERFTNCGSLKESIEKLIFEYKRDGHVRTEIIRNFNYFERGLEQGIEDGKEQAVY